MSSIEDRLFALQDVSYGDFHSRLMPDYDRKRIIGVRTPALRKLAGSWPARPRAATGMRRRLWESCRHTIL